MFPNAWGISVTLTVNVAFTYAGVAISSAYAKLGNAYEIIGQCLWNYSDMPMKLLGNAYEIIAQCLCVYRVIVQCLWNHCTMSIELLCNVYEVTGLTQSFHSTMQQP